MDFIQKLALEKCFTQKVALETGFHKKTSCYKISLGKKPVLENLLRKKGSTRKVFHS